MSDGDKQLKVPLPDASFYARQEDMSNLDRLEKLSHDHPVNILVTGGQGCGKSSLVRQFAAFYGRPMATFQVGLLVESGQLFGQQRLKNGDTYYHSFLFPRAIRTAGCVVHLEEINRSETPHALNELFSVLSEDRNIWIDELGLVETAPQVIFFATMNEGEEFSGTDRLDAALRDRFYRVHLDGLPAVVERKVLIQKAGIDEDAAGRLMRVISVLRNNKQMGIKVSIRHSLMMAKLMAQSASLREALIYSLQVSKDTLESLLLTAHVETGEWETDSNGYRPYLA
ncbi:MAG: AAA family ATPase [Desulfomonilaceae bacterium]|nr:AAA family ATPase [Desulfomonilaceae bacterium]